jgi:hypothetical protein
LGPVAEVGFGRESSLSPQRRAVYKALVEAVGSSPGTLTDPSLASQAERILGQHYRRAPAEARRRIDETLDAIEAPHERGRFSRQEPRSRLAYLRRALRDATCTGCNRAAAARVQDAVALAAAPFWRGGFRWDPALVDIWVRVAKG